MTGIYDEEVVSIYDGEDPSTQKAPNVVQDKAAYTVLAATPDSYDLGKMVDQEVKNSTNVEKSDLELKVEQQGQQEFDRAKQDARIGVALSTDDMDTKIATMYNLNEAKYESNLITEATITQGASASTTDAETFEQLKLRVGEQLLRGTAGKLLDNQQFQLDILAMRDELALEMSPTDALGIGGEFVEAIAPFSAGDVYSGIASDLFPEESNRLVDFALPGEAMNFVSEKFKAMSREEQEVYLPLLKKSLQDRAGLMSENGYAAYTAINEIFAEELGLRAKGDFNIDRLFNNATGILDTTLILGSAARLAGKGIKALSLTKPINTVNLANPELARKLHAQLLAAGDTEALTRAVGMAPTDAMAEIYPTFRGAVQGTTPAEVVDEIVGLQAELKKIEDDLAFGINYTNEETRTMQAKVLDSYRKMNGSYHQSFSQLTTDVVEGKGFVVKAAIGPSRDTGFSGYQQAVEHFADNFPDGTKVDFVVRNGDTVQVVEGPLLEELVDQGTKQLKTYSRKADAKRGAGRAGFPDAELRQLEDGRWAWDKPQTEVWYRVEDRYDYNLSLLDEQKLIFDGPTFDKGFVSGSVLSTLADPATKFSRFINKASVRAADIGQGVQNRMFTVVANNFIKPLNRKQQLKVIDIIDQGSKHGRNYTPEDLAGYGLSIEETKAYYALRGVMDLEWSLNNKRVYNTLRRNGNSSIVNQEAGFHAFGRNVDQDAVPIRDGKIDVYNPATDSIETMTKADVDYLYQNGGGMMKSNISYGNAGIESTYIARGLDTGTQVRPLTKQPLEYRPGYVTRFYDENYFVKVKTTKIVDGVRVEKWSVTSAAPTNSDAEKIVGQLKKDNPNSEFQIVIDSGLDVNNRFDTEFDYLRRTGGIITGRRGDHLKGLNDAQAATIDPVQSMMDSISYTSARVSHDDVIAGFEKRWVNTYGKRYGLTEVPQDIKTIAGNTATDKGLQQAKDLASYINAMRGVQGEWALKWRGMMSSVAESLENSLGGGRTVKELGDYVRGFNPVKTMRGLTFTFLLATNPTRQLLLQANQLSFLSGMSPKYFYSGRMGTDFATFAVAAATRNRPVWGRARAVLAKQAKMTEDEFEFLYDSYVRSGLPQSVDSHTFARDGMTDLSYQIQGGLAKRTGRAVANAVKKPMAAVKRVGFDAGEWSNITGTFLVAFRQWQELNPGKNWRTFKVMDDIATDARDLAFNMTKSGELPYQRGALSLATQFLSYQHKALLAMAGAATGKGNKVFAELPKHKRLSLVAHQFLLYGADGFGAGVMVDKVVDNLGLDVPDSAQAVLDGLVYEYMLNKTIQSITGDDTDIDFSSSLAPASGIFGSLNDFTARLFTMDVPSLLMGASGSFTGRVGDVIKNVAIAQEIPDLSNAETLKATLQQAGVIFGGYNNYVRGQAMKTLGHYVSNSGQPLFETTYSEGLFKQLFGINPEATDDYYRIISEMNGGFSNESPLSKLGTLTSGDVDTIADTYYERVLKIYRELGQATIDTEAELWDNQLQAKIALENTIFAILPEDVAWAVRKRIYERVDRNLSTTGVDDLIQNITRTAIRGTQGRDTVEYYLNMLDNSAIPLTPAQRRDVESLIDFMTNPEGK